MERVFARRAAWLAALVVLAAGMLVAATFPDAADYRGAADEGAYYRQGRTLVEEGVFAGYARIAHEYLASPAQQDFPDPLRVGTIAAAATALAFADSYRALSWVSLTAYLLLLVAVWRFARRRWPAGQAVLALVFVAASPLALGMARRALMDSLACLFAALSLFAFVRLLEQGGRRALAVFALATTAAILVKETAVLLLPFYTIVLVYSRLRGGITLSWWRIAAAVLLPPLLALVVYGVLYGPREVVEIAAIVRREAATQAPYLAFSEGPWNRYLVDFTALSPFVLLLAAMYLGYAVRSGADRALVVVAVLAAYLLAAYAPLTKSARYLLLFDVCLRLLAAAMVMRLPELLRRFARPRPAGLVAATFVAALVIASDAAAYRRYFVAGGVYDPVTYALLRVDRMVPAIAADATQAAGIAEARRAVQSTPDADHYVELAYRYCAADEPLECRWASLEALRLAPDDARAHNDLCAAYNGLHAWNDAVAECREALRLRPDYALARNNLDWALSQAAKEGSAPASH
ncbi:MAG TPA: glycosyltransferase family 39 protein [Rudaea sp.]|nr:glycosyltransferase family 39 protein [Rudaea sp.]